MKEVIDLNYNNAIMEIFGSEGVLVLGGVFEWVIINVKIHNTIYLATAAEAMASESVGEENHGAKFEKLNPMNSNTKCRRHITLCIV
jgi:hypothetical protein